MDINIVDFHSHILPRIDDGSHSVEESIKMLEMEAAAGIKTMAATPHFYPDSDTPSRFLARRAEAFEKLQEKLTDALPKILLGAEIAYFEGMRNCEELKHLAISETRLVLIEMPEEKLDRKNAFGSAFFSRESRPYSAYSSYRQIQSRTRGTEISKRFRKSRRNGSGQQQALSFISPPAQRL